MTKYDQSITSVMYEDSVVFSIKLYFIAVLRNTAYGSVTCLIYKTDHTFVTLLFGNETVSFNSYHQMHAWQQLHFFILIKPGKFVNYYDTSKITKCTRISIIYM